MKKDTHIYELCKKHMHAYVLAEMNDGSQVDGIITGLDEEHVYFAVPRGCAEAYEGQQRQFASYGYGGAYPGYGSGAYDGYGGYGGFGPAYGYGPYPAGPGQRFRRLVLPLAAIAAISLLPWY